MLEKCEDHKMYFLVHEDVPVGNAINSVAHAAIAMHDKMCDDPHYRGWKEHSFKKVVCKVNEKQFQKAKQFVGAIVMTESKLGGRDVVVVFPPMGYDETPNVVRYAPLYK